MKKNYLIVIDSEYVRDSQIAPTLDADPSSDDWFDIEAPVMLGVYEADDEAAAKQIASNNYGYKVEMMTVYETSNKRGN